MNSKICKALALTLMALVLVAGTALAQGYGQGQQPPKQPAPPTQPGQAPAQPETPAAPPVNAEEEAGYKAFFELKSDGAELIIQKGEEFLKKFPESRYRESVYSKLATAYWALEDVDKMFAASEKALELNPNNVDVLSVMALVMSRRAQPGSLDFEQKIAKVEKYARQAITLLGEVQKPAGLTDEEFVNAKNQKLAMVHSGLGMVYFRQQKIADAIAEFEQATMLVPNADPVDYFLLGLCLQQTKRFSDAATAFEKCATSPVMQGRCQPEAEKAKKQAAAQPAPPKP